MTQKIKKILLWTGISGILVASIVFSSTFVILQQRANKKNDDEKQDNNFEKKENIPNEKNNEKENQSERENKDELELKEIDWKTIFPKIQNSDYYDKLNYRNGQAWIDEDMIVYIIKDILNRMLVNNGVVKYAYKQIDDQNLVITFKWNNDKEKSVVTYKINTNKI